MVARIITPALAQGSVACWVVTWAETVPSPGSACQSKWKLSAVSQMSPPPTVSFQVPEEVSWSWPGGSAPPTSAHDQEAGQMNGGALEPGTEARLSTSDVAVVVSL